MCVCTFGVCVRATVLCVFVYGCVYMSIILVSAV